MIRQQYDKGFSIKLSREVVALLGQLWQIFDKSF